MALSGKLPAQPFHSRHVIKMSVATDDRQTILSGECGHPGIVLGDRTSVPPKSFAQVRIVNRCLHVDRENDRFVDKEVKKPSETTTFTRFHQSVSVLAYDDYRKMMLMFLSQNFRNRRIAGEES